MLCGFNFIQKVVDQNDTPGYLKKFSLWIRKTTRCEADVEELCDSRKYWSVYEREREDLCMWESLYVCEFWSWVLFTKYLAYYVQYVYTKHYFC